MTRICLNMIVKNEAHCIGRVLRSALPLVDCVSITDTGSTDGTQDIIFKTCLTNGVPCKVNSTEFRDFAQARNRSLDLCRDDLSMVFDYILLIDADQEFQGIIDKGALTKPAYSMRINDGQISYWRGQLVHRDLDARYIGVTHEYLDLCGIAPTKLSSVSIRDYADGSNRASKFARDIELLLNGLLVEPQNSRYVFYLAQSYQNSGDYTSAIQVYRDRINAGGWEEEVWYSKYMIAKCLELNGDSCAGAYWEAYNYRPWRAEPLYALARHYRQTQQYDSCFAICVTGLDIPYPKDDVLFVEDRVYRFGFREEMSISGYYSKMPARRANGRDQCSWLSVQDDLPTKELAANNLRCYK